MTNPTRTRDDVISLLRRFDEPPVRERWLEHQAMLWEWEPSVVLSVLASPVLVPAGRVALSPTPSASTGAVAVLDSTLLRSSSVHLVPDTGARHPSMSWLQSVDALRALFADLSIEIPALPPLEASTEEWGKTATWILACQVLETITGDDITADISRAIVWTALGLRVDVVPAPAALLVDDWQQTLDALTLAASAAGTMLTVLAAGGGGRELASHSGNTRAL